MIGLEQYLAFLGVSLLVICTPGQDTALTIRNTLLGGRPGGAATAVGVSAGQAVWTVATSAGLAVILMASGPLFSVVRLAGAAYLIYLGVRSLLKARSHSGGDIESSSVVVLLALGLNFSLLTLAWLLGYTFAVDRVSRLLIRTSIRRRLDAVLGAVLVGLGLRLATEAR